MDMQKNITHTTFSDLEKTLHELFTLQLENLDLKFKVAQLTSEIQRNQKVDQIEKKGYSDVINFFKRGQ